MTQAMRDDLVKFIKDKTKSDVRSKEAARKLLISEGIYTKSGNFTASFGGRQAKSKSAA